MLQDVKEETGRGRERQFNSKLSRGGLCCDPLLPRRTVQAADFTRV
jgi:hypothetical protein